MEVNAVEFSSTEKKYSLFLPLVDLAHNSLGGLESIREETISCDQSALNPS